MTTQEIVSKLWNLCNVLRDDGITYHQYVTELTYILFLKMAKETGTEEQIPEKYRWDELKAKSGVELKKFYKELLSELGDNGTGRIREIYQGAATNIDEPKNLEKIIATIDSLDWYSAREEGLGNLYEGLLEKNANEKKSGAGQYFTPRVLIDVMTKLMKPQVGERCLINPLYLMHIVQSPQIQKWLTDNSKGTAQKGIYLNALSLMIIPIPPLAEQARIVELIHIAYKQLDLISNALL